MLTFKEFQKKAKYLPIIEQKECYYWYIKGCKQGWMDHAYPEQVSTEKYYDIAEDELKESKKVKSVLEGESK